MSESATLEQNPTTYNFRNTKKADIDIKLIKENTDSLRPVVDKQSVEYRSLADSVKRIGVMQPILVREIVDPVDGSTKYGLIDGLHRYNAAMDAGMDTIPANIGELAEADLLEAQIIANATRIETSPVQYTKALLKILAANPNLTVADLCVRINQSPEWFYKRLHLMKLNEPIRKLVDNGTLGLGNAFVLAQFEKDKQDELLQQAISKTAVDFKNSADAILKEVRKAKNEGRQANVDVFTPASKLRRLPEIKDELDYLEQRPEASKLFKMAQEAGVSTVSQALAFGLKFAANLDPASIATQKNQWEAERKADADKKAAKKKEKEEKEKAKAINGIA